MLSLKDRRLEGGRASATSLGVCLYVGDGSWSSIGTATWWPLFAHGSMRACSAQRSVAALLEGSLSLRLKLCAPSTASPLTEGMVLLCRLCVSAVSGGGVFATEA